MYIALLGNPNVGKSSVFNRLTGLSQQVGNFAGVTVDKHTGSFKLPNGKKALITDLPGIYSLYPNAIDERVALSEILNFAQPQYPNLFLYVMDITQLERNMLLLTQLQDLNLPIIAVLTMADVAHQTGLECNTELLSQKLNLPAITINGRTGEGIDALKKAIENHQHTPAKKYFLPTTLADAHALQTVQTAANLPNQYAALLHLHHYKSLGHLEPFTQNKISQVAEQTQFKSLPFQVSETMLRFEHIIPICRQVLYSNATNTQKKGIIYHFDRLATHPVLGVLVFLGILFLMFQAVFSWSQPFVNGIENGFALLNDFLVKILPNAWFSHLLTEGILSGLGGILVFVPQIAILSLIIAVLEDTGYMSRAMFMTDGLMRKFGLNGRSMVSLVSGAACAVPAIMATRNIPNRKERLITILVTPFISCSARIPVFAILVGLVIPAGSIWGVINVQGLVIMGLYLLGVVAALVSAWLLKMVLKSHEPSIFILEMPQYRPPHWKNVFITVWQKVKAFVAEAGKIIMLISMVLWFAASYGPADLAQNKQPAASTNKVLNVEQQNAQKLENSFAGYLGKAIEPAIAPLGFDWKIGIALITSFAAREVFVGTMATIYSLNHHSDEVSQTLSERMRTEKNAKTGAPIYTMATSFSLLVFYVLAMQCMSTLAVVRRETNSWLWALAQLVYMTAAAYMLSYVVYNYVF